MRSRLDSKIVLTARKVEILRRYADDQTVGAIAKSLGISAETVYEHLEVMRRRLGAHTGPGLIRIAYRHGFIPRDD